jgi:hypothetical protein
MGAVMERGAMSEERAGKGAGRREAGGVMRRRPSLPLLAARCTLLAATLACSPEARRVRDGGPGADPNNKELVSSRPVNPTAADTTLWPEKAPTPVDRLAAGRMAPPAPITAAPAPGAGASKAAASRTPATTGDRRSFDRGTGADPRRPSGSDSARPRPPRE